MGLAGSGASGDYVTALNPQTGAVVWNNTLANSTTATSAVVASDGTVYVVGQDTVYAFNGTTGTQQWTDKLPNTAQPQGDALALDSDGTLYVPMLGSAGGLFAVR